MAIEHHKDYIHHQKPGQASLVREIVFGMEDGMVSTMGAITGIAAGTMNHFTVVLAGFVIIAVESISMSVGSYISSKSEKEVDDRKLYEEGVELDEYPEEEKKELSQMYVKDGWPKDLAAQMSEAASKNKQLFLQEMAYRELKVFPESTEHPLKNGLAMGISYIIGGSIPLLPYLLLPSVPSAIVISVVITPIALFALGSATTRFTKRSWWRAGLEMLFLASAAGAIGYCAAQAVSMFK